MSIRVLKCAASIAVAIALFPLVARSQSQENAAVVIHVTDSASGKPIDNAQVFLLGGDTPQSSLTNAQGLLIFEVPPALYHVEVKAAGYADSTSAEVDVGEGQRAQVAVKMTLRTIATLVAHAGVNVSSIDVNENSAERKVSQSLSDALSKIAGVTVDDQLYGANSAFNISLHGADASQTGYSIDGVRVGGASAQATSGLQDLFSGSSVNFSPSAMSSGGTVNFYTAQPTKLWSYHFTGTVGNYGNTAGTWMATGGGGKFAFALEHSGGGKDYPLDGKYFADESGKAYVHQGGYARNADMMKASLTLSPVSTLKYTLMGGTSDSSYICASETTLLPCGNGPDNATHGSNIMQTLGFSSLAGNLQYNLFANYGRYRYEESQPYRAVNGSRSPYAGSGSFPWLNAGLYLSSSARRHTFSGGFYTSLERSSYVSSYNGTQSVGGTRSERYGSLWLSDKVKANDKLAITHTLSRAGGTGAGTSLELDEELTWQPRTADVFSAGLALGSAEPTSPYTSAMGDPVSATFDCYNKSIFVEGPSDEAVHQSSTQYNLGWRHTWKGGFVNVDTYRNNFLGQSARVAVPFGTVPASLFPNGPSVYMQQLQSIWSQPTECGTLPFDASRVYVTQLASGIGQVSQGFTVSAQIPLGRHLLLYPSYATTNTYFSTLDPRLSAPGGLYTPGAQLPHHPLHTAGLIIDGIVPHSPVEWLADAQFTSANNPQNLPGHTVYSAGVIVHTLRGSLQFLESNLFGSHTGLFTTYQGVNPIPVQGGGTFAYATTPLAPRTFTMQYTVRWHQHESPKKSAKP